MLIIIEILYEQRKIPIKKCLNDIYGFRMIMDEDINCLKIKKFIEENYPDLKCIKAIRGEYTAVHIYFGNNINTNFQWELQLWDKKHVISNLISHHTYKQNYIKWEGDFK